MKSESLLREIRDSLAYISSRVAHDNKQGYTDFNKYAEKLFKPIFGHIYNKEFRQFKIVNQPGIDLYSLDDEIAIQVTSDSSADKLRHTLDTFLKFDLHKKYDALYIFFLKENKIKPTTVLRILKEPKYKDLGDRDTINEKWLLDTNELYRLIDDCPSETQQQIHQYLSKEFSSAQIFVPIPLSDLPKYSPIENYIERHLYTSGNNNFWLLDSERSNLHRIVKGKLTDKVPFRIIVKAGAGEGKSVELNNLAYQIQIHQPAFYPLRLSIKNYTGDLTNFITTQYKFWDQLPKSEVLLLVDGVDEITPQYQKRFVLEFNHFLESEPQLNVVYTIRANFDSEVIAGSLKQFETYYIDRLTPGDIYDYIENQSEQADELKKLIEAKSWLKSVIDIPFYLVQIAKLSQGAGHWLPDNLEDFYNKIIENRLSSDWIKYNGDLDRLKVLNALKKLAVYMTLQGENTTLLSNALKVTQLEQDEIRRISFLSIIVHGMDYYISFIHNNFQEYLCAQWLLDLEWLEIEDIVFNNDKKFLNTKLLNTTTLLFSLLPQHDPRHVSLFTAVYKADYSILLEFERERIPFENRLELFKKFVLDGKDKKIAYLAGDYSARRLVDFIDSSTDGLDFVLEEINENNRTSNHFRSLLFLLYEFSQRGPSYKKKQEIFAIIDGLVTQEGFDEDEYQEMITIIDLIGLFDIELLENRIKKCPLIHYTVVLSKVIDLIRKHNIPGQFEFVLRNANNLSKNRGKSYSSSYKWVFSQYIIENLNRENYMLLLDELVQDSDTQIRYLLDEINIIDGQDKFKKIDKIYLKLAELYKTTNKDQIIIDFIGFLNQVNYDSYSQNHYGNAALFFENLDIENLLETLLVFEPFLQSGHIYMKLFDLDTIDHSKELIKLHSEGKINDERLISFYCMSHSNSSPTSLGLYQYLSQLLPETIGPYITQEQINDNNNRRAQKDIELLSNKDLFIEMVQKIIDYVKANTTPEISENDILSFDWKYEKSLKETFECDLPIDFMRWDCSEMPNNKIIRYIQDDDNWFKYVARVMLRYKREGKPSVSLESTKRFLQGVVNTKTSSINYKMLDGWDFKRDDIEILIALLFKEKIIELSQEKAIELLYFEQIRDHLSSSQAMIDFLIEKYSLAVITPQFIDSIQNEQYHSEWLKITAIQQCQKHKITEVQEDVFELLQDKKFTHKSICFDYLRHMKFNKERLLQYLMKNPSIYDHWQLELIGYIYESAITHPQLKELITNKLVINPESYYSLDLHIGIHVFGLRLGSLFSMRILFEHIKDLKHVYNLRYPYFEQVESSAPEELFQLSLETLEIYRNAISDHSGDSICGVMDAIITNLASQNIEKYEKAIAFYDRLLQDYGQEIPRIYALEWWKIRLTKRYQERNSIYLSEEEVLELIN